jgi:phage tail-like protein
MPRQDPLRNFRFRLEIDGIQTAGFSEVSILETTTDAIDYREGTDPTHVRKLTGLTKYGNITLKRGALAGAHALDLYEWHASVVAGNVQAIRRQVAIIVIGEYGSDQARFVVSEAWPVKYVAGALNAKANEVLIEELELVNEGIQRVR